jgi:MFS family permease
VTDRPPPAWASEAPPAGASLAHARAGRARAARVAVSAVFFLNGAGVGNWVVRIPAVRDRLGLTESALGVALLGVAVGALVAMPVAGRLVARYGSRPVTRAGALAMAAALALPGLAPSLPLLVLALLALGAGNGVLNVAMNGQAATVERRYGRPIMSRFHALFSLGGLAGAAMGGAAADAGLDPAAHLALVALVSGVAAAGSAAGMLPADADAAPEHAAFAWPARPLVALGVVAFCVLFGEGAMADWSAVYLRDVAGAGPGAAAAGYAAFSLRWPRAAAWATRCSRASAPPGLVAGAGALAAVGLAAALLVGAPWGAVVGFGFVGAGLSVVFPTCSHGRRVPGTAAGPAIAAVSTMGYTGFLAGPPLIGFLAARPHAPRARVAVVALTSARRAARSAASTRRRPGRAAEGAPSAGGAQGGVGASGRVGARGRRREGGGGRFGVRAWHVRRGVGRRPGPVAPRRRAARRGPERGEELLAHRRLVVLLPDGRHPHVHRQPAQRPVDHPGPLDLRHRPRRERDADAGGDERRPGAPPGRLLDHPRAEPGRAAGGDHVVVERGRREAREEHERLGGEVGERRLRPGGQGVRVREGGHEPVLEHALHAQPPVRVGRRAVDDAHVDAPLAQRLGLLERVELEEAQRHVGHVLPEDAEHAGERPRVGGRLDEADAQAARSRRARRAGRRAARARPGRAPAAPRRGRRAPRR